MKKELETKYNHLPVEGDKYENWNKKGLFKADVNSKKPPFCIVLPPPNVTGKLHLGHAWDGSLQDAIMRFKKLNGFDTLFIPGTDHAGIATQTKVEAMLKEATGKNRFDFGREAFLKEVWKWKEKYSQTIHEQWAKMGLSLDYSMENFTLNPQVNELVKFVFVEMYEKGLIYRGKRIVNWDPVQKSAISNIEVIYRETVGKMYHFKYQLLDSDEVLEIATTRPETMFADQCVVVNPKDQRYTKYIGKTVINPVNQHQIPVIADDYVEMDFGTGVMKCTPAHDLNDFEIGVRHNLAKPICLNEDGTVNAMGGDVYQGLDRFDARELIIQNAIKANTLIKVEEITHQVGYSERTNAIVEPYLSNQWFVKMDYFSQQVLALQNSDEAINFFPSRFNQTLKQWMENSFDWTISRQLWWGHQIPAWYNKNDPSKIHVGMNAPVDAENWSQDEDVLDTWFSSGLWPFATLLWTKETPGEWFERYYPTNVLVTGYDIIFFWVARMIFQGQHFTNQKPFNDILIHGLVRDEFGNKMSKSLGNGIDPMDVIEQYGVDSLRFFLLTNSTPGFDIKYSEEKIRHAWNFMNKLWNASRYVLINLDEHFKVNDQLIFSKHHENTIDLWILTELTKTMNNVKTLIDKYEFGLAGKEIYDFVWSKYCSWYIEFAKVNLNASNPEIVDQTKQVLFYVLKNILIMLHPYAPFITEEIYQYLNLKDSIMNEEWIIQSFDYNTDYINVMINLITVIREFRNTNNIKNAIPLNFHLNNLNQEHQKLFEQYLNVMNQSLKVFVNAQIHLEKINDPNISSISIEEYFLEIQTKQFINQDDLIQGLKDKMQELEQEIKRSEAMLNNQNFIVKASVEKVDAEKAKYANYQEQLSSIKNKLKNM
ncbi:valine--tRNA ligase [Williamsoniiplasma luminosum]|uniref:Valine--tRNA ligase n=1 Tax=Williamsoniiplasma luminosum TaxID=214888 RepID=A0A2S0NJC0_9MOLU|nr:valine--tRNA ligase [Williamsoniiplasma luminosum]AVP49123.1 MAG: valine--tRNA ligase [Williamsoniiplasma luminosum]